MTTHVSETIRGFFPKKGDLPNRVRCTRQDVAGKTYTWSAEHGMYLADDGGDGFMTWYVARGRDVIFFEIKEQPQQLSLSLRVA